jgi:hypothetical protein
MLSLKTGGTVAPTTTRVPRHTPDYLNRRIRRRSRENVESCAVEPGRIQDRLAELDREWDIERALEANASSLVVLGTLLGYLVSSWFYWIPLLVGSFLLQHAIQGWCPPIRLFRRLGFRTHAEIAAEYYSLRALRGDFRELMDTGAKTSREKAGEIFAMMSWAGRQEEDAGEKSGS